MARVTKDELLVENVVLKAENDAMRAFIGEDLGHPVDYRVDNLRQTLGLRPDESLNEFVAGIEALVAELDDVSVFDPWSIVDGIKGNKELASELQSDFDEQLAEAEADWKEIHEEQRTEIKELEAETEELKDYIEELKDLLKSKRIKIPEMK